MLYRRAVTDEASAAVSTGRLIQYNAIVFYDND